jgi:hypothetical protein
VQPGATFPPVPDATPLLPRKIRFSCVRGAKKLHRVAPECPLPWDLDKKGATSHQGCTAFVSRGCNLLGATPSFSGATPVRLHRTHYASGAS